ncbi:MAG: hypothetical protein NT136_01155 [Candidatus Moranbacteria bacterium]|nr:hypothetical protein [Candidatus Moranbacteria bacterium]
MPNREIITPEASEIDKKKPRVESENIGRLAKAIYCMIEDSVAILREKGNEETLLKEIKEKIDNSDIVVTFLTFQEIRDYIEDMKNKDLRNKDKEIKYEYFSGILDKVEKMYNPSN